MVVFLRFCYGKRFFCNRVYGKGERIKGAGENEGRAADEKRQKVKKKALNPVGPGSVPNFRFSFD